MQVKDIHQESRKREDADVLKISAQGANVLLGQLFGGLFLSYWAQPADDFSNDAIRWMEEILQQADLSNHL